MRRPGRGFATSSASSRARSSGRCNGASSSRAPTSSSSSTRAAPSALPESPTALVGRGEELDGASRRSSAAGHASSRSPAPAAAARPVSRSRSRASRRRRTRTASPSWSSRRRGTRLRRPDDRRNARRGRARRGSPCSRSLAAALQPRELLLVLDNAEHVREAAPAFVELLRRAPRLTVLVTSRAVLHVSGEHVFPVGPLGGRRRRRALRPSCSALDPGFAPTDGDRRGGARDLPAARRPAARARARGGTGPRPRRRGAARAAPERLTLLTGGPRDLPARQQTLSETIAWSANLLSQREREVFAALSVFPAGATLAAAEAVGGADLDVLAALVDHCLVRRDDQSPASRASRSSRRSASTRRELLAREAADGARGAATTRGMVCRARGASGGRARRRHADGLVRDARSEHDNLRAGLAELHERDGSEELLRLAVPLFRFWYVRGLPHRGPSLARARARRSRAGVRHAPPPGTHRGRCDRAPAGRLRTPRRRFAERALEVARELDDRRFVANALSNLGAIVLAAGDEARAEDVLEEAVELAREVGDERIRRSR